MSLKRRDAFPFLFGCSKQYLYGIISIPTFSSLPENRRVKKNEGYTFSEHALVPKSMKLQSAAEALWRVGFQMHSSAWNGSLL